MHSIIIAISFVSTLAASPAPKGVTRELVQGSGIVTTFEHASDMPRHVVTFVRVVRGGK
jgi:hypothetical protein